MLVCCCRNPLAVDHTSLSRRSTAPAPIIDTSNVWALITCFQAFGRMLLPALSRSCFAFYCYRLSPKRAIVFSVKSQCTKFFRVIFIFTLRGGGVSRPVSNVPLCQCTGRFCFFACDTPMFCCASARPPPPATPPFFVFMKRELLRQASRDKVSSA